MHTYSWSSVPDGLEAVPAMAFVIWKQYMNMVYESDTPIVYREKERKHTIPAVCPDKGFGSNDNRGSQ